MKTTAVNLPRAAMLRRLAIVCFCVALVFAIWAIRARQSDIPAGSGERGTDPAPSGTTLAPPERVGRCAASVLPADLGPERTGSDANPPTAAIALLDAAVAADPTTIGGFWASSDAGRYFLNVGVLGDQNSTYRDLDSALGGVLASSRWELRYVKMRFSKQEYSALQTQVQAALDGMLSPPPGERPEVLPGGWPGDWVVVWVPDPQGPAAALVQSQFAGRGVCFVDVSDAGRGWARAPAMPANPTPRIGAPGESMISTPRAR